MVGEKDELQPLHFDPTAGVCSTPYVHQKDMGRHELSRQLVGWDFRVGRLSSIGLSWGPHAIWMDWIPQLGPSTAYRMCDGIPCVCFAAFTTNGPGKQLTIGSWMFRG